MQNIVIRSMNDNTLVLNTGSDQGAQRGALYAITRGEKLIGRVRISRVRRDESIAVILDQDPGVKFAVGDTARLISATPTAEDLQPSTGLSPATQATPSARQAPRVKGAPPASGEPASSTPSTSSTSPASSTPAVSPVTGNAPVQAQGSGRATAIITSVEGTTVTLNTGEIHGVRAGRKVTVLREGEVVGIVRVQTVAATSSTGVVIWHDESAPSIAAGDVVALNLPLTTEPSGTGTPVSPGVTTLEGLSSPAAPAPAAPMLLESGASNAVVPRTDRTYEYLAALAASGLIQRYPAYFFYDEGVRFHRTAEDLSLSRAQIAELIQEALGSKSLDEVSSRDRVALNALMREYSREMQQLETSGSALSTAVPVGGFKIGVSGQQRVSLIGGSRNNFLEPFSERQGGLRTKSGLDTRTNVFGQINEKLRFFATIDAGTKTHSRGSTAAVAGNNNGTNESNFTVRRAIASYDASSLLRGLTVEVGRDEVWWGPGHFGTLILSDVAGPLNLLQYKFQRGSVTARGLYAPLGRGPGGGSRSLYGKNTEIRMGPQVRIGLAETVLSPRDSFDPLLLAATFSPIPLLAIERIDSKERNNVQGAAYIEASVARGARVYGELLIDDIGVNNNNRVLNRIGTLMGAHLFHRRDPGKFGIYGEYAKLQGRTYLNFNAGGLVDPDYDYFYRGRPLGYPVAPLPGAPVAGLPALGGAESLRFEGYWRPVSRLRLTAGIELADLNSEQPVLARQQTLRFSAAYNLARRLTLIARAQRVSTSQPNFIANEPALTQRLFQLEVAHAF